MTSSAEPTRLPILLNSSPLLPTFINHRSKSLSSYSRMRASPVFLTSALICILVQFTLACMGSCQIRKHKYVRSKRHKNESGNVAPKWGTCGGQIFTIKYATPTTTERKLLRTCALNDIKRHAATLGKSPFFPF